MSKSSSLKTERRGMMVVLSSPSGAGKTTLSRMLLERTQQQEGMQSMVLSISVTTRAMRPGEVDARDYFFIDRARFDALANKGELLEHAEVFGHCYGTPASFVESHISKGRDVLFDIDWQGTRQLAEKRRLDLVSIFILPPTMDELKRRLLARAQDSEAVVEKRMSKAASEISHWQEYDYVLVNEDLESTLAKIETIVQAEKIKRLRQNWLPDFVSDLVSAS
jgi:guanylate kinase